MMQNTFVCKNCNQEKPANPRLKGTQKYCNAPACQRARKAEWQRQKLAAKPKYRRTQSECDRQWRRAQRASQYQRQYREKHPDYVAKNREQQKIRNQKRKRQTSAEMIVKMDALKKDTLKNVKSNIYIMTPITMDASLKIVKMDSFIAQLICL